MKSSLTIPNVVFKIFSYFQDIERCVGLVVTVPATGSARPGFESLPSGPLHRVVGGAADLSVHTVQITSYNSLAKLALSLQKKRY